MRPILKRNKNYLLALLCSSMSWVGICQGDASTVKAQFALGLNTPSSNGFVGSFEGNAINFPSINLGLQYMFMPKLGAKLDFGYNSFSNAERSPEFKLNYTRINLQLVYDASKLLSFSNKLGLFLHAGPGSTTIKPLGNYGDNKTTFLNTVTGLEIHYGVSDKLSVYLDTSYILGFGKEFNPISSGFGSFNGHLLTVTIGASISLSGCYYCGD
ncbi:outer membrane beta-barrel protein [Tamlana sp. 2201CG12-4]|uniref:outer membrane beta-barrel protein n=1 Tax=Tamlana sp. 2201CG12-4 TaxID=3112582 RepID=UPI002DBA4B50|nr:outer membrane beta-barrel protein [Tamlana sp. 2201CG12-4]MEC3906700.1 outer membrane beta-barrel protein [Tamlana sp. 2201CG12-4]